MKAGLGILGVLCCALSPLPLAAQEAATGEARWFLRGLQAGLCVDFLVSPAIAADQIGGHGIATPAESLETAFPALAREVHDEPQYQGWIPAEYCWYLYASGVADGREFQVEDGRQPVAVGYLSISASGLPGGATGFATTLFTNASPLSRLAESRRFRVEKIKFTRGPVPEEEDIPDHFRYEAQHGSTTIQWDGSPGDAHQPESVTIRLAGLGIANGIHSAEVIFTPDSAFSPSGGFRVIGKGELQSMLATSPIRLVTSFLRGGDAEWDLNQ